MADRETTLLVAALYQARSEQRHGFTLLELVTALVVVLILVVLALGSIDHFRTRAEKTACMSNLRSLYAAASSRVNDAGWPQIDPADLHEPAYAKAWIDALAPYGLSAGNWVCPTMQRLLADPDLTKAENIRVDYIAMPFDEHPTSPRQYPKHPWFVETGDVHGEGNFVLFADGTIAPLSEIIQTPPPP